MAWTGAVADRDWVGINMVAGTTYEIDVVGLGGEGGTLLDPYLRILNESGNDVLHEEDGYLLGDHGRERRLHRVHGRLLGSLLPRGQLGRGVEHGGRL